jgi:hypothetical protein
MPIPTLLLVRSRPALRLGPRAQEGLPGLYQKYCGVLYPQDIIANAPRIVMGKKVQKAGFAP